MQSLAAFTPSKSFLQVKSGIFTSLVFTYMRGTVKTATHQGFPADKLES
jgi:hypothetical protein